jgi:hypothetical protein
MKRALIILFFALTACGAPAQDQVSAADLARLFLGKAADTPPQACVNKIVTAMANPPVGAAADEFTKLLDSSTSPLCATYLISVEQAICGGKQRQWWQASGRRGKAVRSAGA